MKKHISLKWFVILALVSLIVVLVIGYSLLSAHFFIRGMDNVTSGLMFHAMESYLDTVPAETRRQLNSFSGYLIAPDWQLMPETLRNHVARPEKINVMSKHTDGPWFHRGQQLTFIMHYQQGTAHYFIARILHHANASPLMGQQALQSMRFLLALSLGIVTTVAILMLLLFRRISGPVNGLANWARQLNENNLQQAPPDFTYPELNNLANLIRSSLSSVQESLEREQNFLRHSSHELRTPISIIRNNIELLHKRQQTANTTMDQRQQQIINRIDRASLTMKNLTETLLWLSRETELPTPIEEFDLDLLIEEVIRENRYLLNDKNVEVALTIEPCLIASARIPARIILNNLIRNAFQHSWQGQISIRQQQRVIAISNDIPQTDTQDTDLGFGLGLQLTEQLSDKMGWVFQRQIRGQQHLVSLQL